MKFGFVSSIAAVFLCIPLMAVAQQCRPMCCDAVVASISPPGKIGSKTTIRHTTFPWH
ncbi:hypothetical protein BDZ97DRAFT_1820688 [Flammula alnicola]|nr:hypothetical protein BDZ97DRAFT_1820688 [Flammula alnicola]